ncbi:response regulator [Altericista sp. CCNU0014]|uniref:response regulator n=1 Tax=Altericista sp. CCNU0014 TaxID=3082949 RepID=UPI00384B82AF
MGNDITVMTKLFQELKRIQMMQLSGKLALEVAQVNQPRSSTWHIYFYMGRVVWATGGMHRNRRWFRAVKQFCPPLMTQDWIRRTAAIMTDSEEAGYWEIRTIDLAVQAGVMTPDQAKAIVANYVQEVFFCIIDRSDVQCQWSPLTTLPQQFVWLDVDRVVENASILGAQWRKAISQYLSDWQFDVSPDLAPVVKQPEKLQSIVSPGVYQGLTKVLTGQNTVWDVALIMKKPFITVVSSLIPFVQDDIMGLNTIPDAVFPGFKPQVVVKPIESKGLIACIDDSPVIGKELEAILNPLGYEVFSILDPLQSLTILLQKKPKLIFLDLVMPNTNGYELCSFLRKSPLFKELPIIMLTGHDGVIDRLRAKVAGSTDFLSKPPEAVRVMQVVQKFLSEMPIDDSSEVVSQSINRTVFQ